MKVVVVSDLVDDVLEGGMWGLGGIAASEKGVLHNSNCEWDVFEKLCFEAPFGMRGS